MALARRAGCSYSNTTEPTHAAVWWVGVKPRDGGNERQPHGPQAPRKHARGGGDISYEVEPLHHGGEMR